MNFKTLTSQILTRFPKNRISFCSAFALDATQPVEVLFCVDNLHEWHDENISMNPSHYSFMRFCGSTLLTNLQLRGGASTYCYPRVQLSNGLLIQYETISEGDFCYDLNHWVELHVSGYLHKPVETIVAADSNEIAVSIENNIQNALRIALLILPEEFSYQDLFIEIALFAYDGKQFKTTRTKNREKIHEMVEPKMQDYFQYYLSHLKQHFSHCIQLPDPNEMSDGKIRQDKSTEVIRKHFLALPSAIFTVLGELVGSEELSEENINWYIENQEILGENLKSSLIQTVGRTHRKQEVNNLVTATIPNAMTKLFASVAGRTLH